MIHNWSFFTSKHDEEVLYKKRLVVFYKGQKTISLNITNSNSNNKTPNLILNQLFPNDQIYQGGKILKAPVFKNLTKIKKYW